MTLPVLSALFSLLAFAAHAAQPQPTKPPAPTAPPPAITPDTTRQTTATPTDKPALPVAGAVKTVDDLLAALEKADENLFTLTASVRYVNIAGKIEGGDRQTREGEVKFVNKRPEKRGTPGEPAVAAPPAAPARSASVHFKRITRGDTLREEDREFIIHAGVLVEKVAAEKHLNRYRLGDDAAKVDPFKIGEGPFPIPFGQKADDIKARFTAELLDGLADVPTASDGAKKLFEQSYQLRLIPKDGTRAAKDYTEARIWLAQKDLLPIMARTRRLDGGSDEFFLLNVRLNLPIDDAVFDTATPAGWTQDEKDLR